MKKDITIPQQYLMPKNTDKTPLGIILAIHKNVPFKISILIFYDYRTGRIERYLVNSEKDINTSHWKDINNDIFIYKNQKFLLNNSHEHDSESLDMQNIYNPLINDGKLSLDFFKMFIYELMRDYIYILSYEGGAPSYNYTNMDVIRRLTHPK
jgi:hypothetical protein